MADSDFVKVAAVSELPPGDMKAVDVGDEQVLLVNVDGAVHACDDICTHAYANLSEGDEIVLSVMEHHSNIVPWQIVAQRTGAVIRVVPVDDLGNFLFDEYTKLLSPRTKMVALTHVSNALGTVVPIAEAVRLAHDAGALVLVDGCQAAPHMSVDVQALNVDFYVFSGHKLYGPSGIGVLYGRESLLEEMPPYQGGGEMIDRVTFEKTTYAELPFKFEAGTPHIAGTIALGEAIDYLEALGFDAIGAHERKLLEYATERLSALNTVDIVGMASEKAAILSFNVRGVHPHDVGTILDHDGIAVRTGHHCAQPIMDRFDVAATVRASFGLYNTVAEVDALIEGIGRVREIFG